MWCAALIKKESGSDSKEKTREEARHHALGGSRKGEERREMRVLFKGGKERKTEKI